LKIFHRGVYIASTLVQARVYIGFQWRYQHRHYMTSLIGRLTIWGSWVNENWHGKLKHPEKLATVPLLHQKSHIMTWDRTKLQKWEAIKTP
jgi:hypothetical protein